MNSAGKKHTNQRSHAQTGTAAIVPIVHQRNDATERNVSANGRKHPDGFMLIELIAVLFMIAIFSFVFIGRYFDANTETRAALDVLKSHIRYTQAKAIGTSSNWYILIASSGSAAEYSLHQADGTANAFPGESDTSVVLDPDIRVTNGTVIFFDRLGRPFTDAKGTVIQSGVRTIASSDIGDVTIKPETGYIE